MNGLLVQQVHPESHLKLRGVKLNSAQRGQRDVSRESGTMTTSPLHCSHLACFKREQFFSCSNNLLLLTVYNAW